MLHQLFVVEADNTLRLHLLSSISRLSMSARNRESVGCCLLSFDVDGTLEPVSPVVYDVAVI